MKIQSKGFGLVAACALLAARVLLPRAVQADGFCDSAELALSASELQAMTQPVPQGIQAHILASPVDFQGLVAKTLDEPASFFVLVEKSRTLPPDFAPDDLVNLKAYPLSVTWGDVLLRKAILPAVLQMTGAAKADGITIRLPLVSREQ